MSRLIGRAVSALRAAPVTALGGKALPTRGRVPEPMSSFAESSVTPRNAPAAQLIMDE